MNKIDIENIKKELAKRNAANYEWADGGDMVKDDIILRTTKELKQLIKDFENNINQAASIKVKELVDKMFEKYGEEGDNMIALTSAYCPERSTSESDPMDIDWGGFENRYNQLYFPICRNWDCGNYWTRQNKDEETLNKWREKWNEYLTDLNQLQNELKNIKQYCSAYQYYKDDNDAINECWYGVIGIMKDYRLVSFVIRDDGMLCDEEGYKTFYNSVIIKL